MLPLHPHCHCRYIGHYSKVHKIVVKNPQLSTMQKFSLNEQRQIVGSYAKLQEFHNGEDITKLFNRVRPDYPVGFYRDVFGYNGGMRTSFKDFGDSIKDSTVTKTTVTHNMFGKYNRYFNDIILSTKNKVENAIVIRDGVFIKHIKSMNKDSVDVPPHLISSSVVIHNHPSGTSFSKDDILLGIAHNAKKLIVFHPDTYIYEASFENINIEKFFLSYDIIQKDVDEYLSDAVSKGAKNNIASFEKQHIIMSELARRNYDFNYKRYKY